MIKETSPWRTMWIEPRSTIRSIIRENPNQSLWILVMFYGFPSLLNAFQSVFLGQMWSVLALFLTALILSPLWGYVAISIFSAFIAWTGKWFKGGASFREVRAASAWSCLPFIGSCAVWVVWLFVFGGRLFLPEWTLIPLSGFETFIFFLGLIVKFVFLVWAIVVYLNALSEVQKFSVVRAVGNAVVGFICLTIVASILFALLFWAMGVSVGSAHTVVQSAMLGI